MTTLIVTEKPSVAARIAKSIGKGSERKLSRNGAPYHQVDDMFIVPAVGHIYGLREKNKGAWRYPVFDIEWTPSYEVSKNSEFTKKYLNNIKFLAKKCDSFINACDYDIEGEVIAFNVIKLACNVDPLSDKVRRMKFSTLTDKSIMEAYKHLEKTDAGMASAGLTRHTLDWFWGINLSRALTLSVRKSHGYVTLSIGRVQGPALKILATREVKIKAFKPELYWQIEMISLKDKSRLSAFHFEDRIWEKEKADSIKDRCGDTAVVDKIKKRKHEQKPPTPFDLTTLQTEAYKHLGMDPRRTLEVAQELYTNAYISYPRTSSQQLLKGIDYKGIIKNLGLMKDYKESSDILLAKKKLSPHNGRKKDPAHPAIHPTGEIPRGLSDYARKVYDLVVRRFLATFGDSAFRETVEIKLNNNSEIFIAKGTRTVDKGWHVLYGRYVKFEEQELPLVVEGEILGVEDIIVHEKETKPPKRYTPASIIREMEKRNIGTKATRSQIVDILFRRGYVTGKAIEVTPLGLNVIDTMEKYCPDVLSEKLTRKFEREMEEIQKGRLSSEKVIEEGRETITHISMEFKGNESKIGEALATSVKSMKAAGKASLGDCLKCDGSLVLRKSKLGQFIGCSNYPKCTFTMSLPKGKITVSGKCKQCDYMILKVGGKKFWSFCINPKCPSKRR
ncbi:MAG: DNA topoisomerase I [Candidatus Altiarchaeota archaeon]|nr:DNA topoisomerase I [Candidatus Altiarchaeota archaeon]